MEGGRDGWTEREERGGEDGRRWQGGWDKRAGGEEAGREERQEVLGGHLYSWGRF